MEKYREDFLDYIHDKDLNQSEKDILSFIIQKRFEDQPLSLRKAADDLFVSTTSIIRVCKKLGFSGYSEFIYNLGLKVTQMAVLKLSQLLKFIDPTRRPLMNLAEIIS